MELLVSNCHKVKNHSQLQNLISNIKVLNKMYQISFLYLSVLSFSENIFLTSDSWLRTQNHYIIFIKKLFFSKNCRYNGLWGLYWRGEKNWRGRNFFATFFSERQNTLRNFGSGSKDQFFFKNFFLWVIGINWEWGKIDMVENFRAQFDFRATNYIGNDGPVFRTSFWVF